MDKQLALRIFLWIVCGMLPSFPALAASGNQQLATAELSVLIGLASSGSSAAAEQIAVRMPLIDTAQIDDTTLTDIGALLQSPVPHIRNMAVRAVSFFGVRAARYVPQLQKIVENESCNYTGIGPGSYAASALDRMGFMAHAPGCYGRQLHFQNSPAAATEEPAS